MDSIIIIVTLLILPFDLVSPISEDNPLPNPFFILKVSTKQRFLKIYLVK